MSLRIASQGVYKVIKASEDLTNPAILGALHEMVGTLISQGETNFLLDLSDITRVNSAIIGVVGDIHRRIKDRSAELNIIMNNPSTAEIFNLTGLGQAMHVYRSMEECAEPIKDDTEDTAKKAAADSPAVEVLTKGEFKVIRVRRELKELKHLEDLRKRVAALAKEGASKFVFDFRGLNSLSSIVLGIVAGLNERIRQNGGTIHVIADSDEVNEVFNVTRLSSFLNIFHTKDDFLASIRRRDENLKQKKILLAVGASQPQKALAKKLEAFGYEIVSAKTGGEVQELCLREGPDLVLLDFHLPAGESLPACRKIKAISPGHYLPVLFLTDAADEAERIKALEAGADDFIRRPFTDEVIIVRIRSHLKIRDLTENLTRINQDLEGRVREQSKSLMEKERRLIEAEKMSMISTFLSGAAHELKNPLFVISGWAQMLKRKGDLNPDQLKCMEFINESTYRCIGIVENLLNLTRSNTVESKNLDLNGVVRTTAEKIKPAVDERGAELKFDLARFAKVTGSPSEMEQVVYHLLTNAADAVTGKRGIILVRTGETAKGCFLEVHDNGAGMSAETQQKIFDPFFTTKEAGKGAGLGMTIVKRIVDGHRGRISIASQPGAGTTVTAFFPRTDAAAGE